jgi:hypothetical protein
MVAPLPSGHAIRTFGGNPTEAVRIPSSFPSPAPRAHSLLLHLGLASLLLTLLPATAASAQEPPYNRGIAAACSAEARGFDPFPDTSPGTHHEAINCMAYTGVTQGRIEGGVPAYQPRGAVTRAQMASFIARVLDAVHGYDLPADPPRAFPDVGGTHRHNIDRLAAVGIVLGREDGTYAPNDNVLRGQMASYVARSIEEVTGRSLPIADVFSDLTPPHDDRVRELAAIGVVVGIDGDVYGPARSVTREEMASFLARTMDHLVSEGFSITVDTPTFPQPIGAFTTPLQPGQARNHNIHLAADHIDGDTIAPGASYSLNAGIGERTQARGYQGNGFIDEDGEIISVVGGGVSQIATTFFNASWFAGIELVSHKPHSQYLERYPAGREATIAWDLIDVVVTNDTPFPIEIATSYTASRVTVTLVGTPWGEVTESWDDAPAWVSSGDAFTVNYGRTVVQPDGSASSDSFSWSYEAAP